MEKRETELFVKEVGLGDLGAKDREGRVQKRTLTDEEGTIYRGHIGKFFKGLVKAETPEAFDKVVESFKEKEEFLQELPYRFSTYYYEPEGGANSLRTYDADLEIYKGTTLDLMLESKFLENLKESKALDKVVVEGENGKAKFNKGINSYEMPHNVKEALAMKVLKELSNEFGAYTQSPNKNLKYKPTEVFNLEKIENPEAKEKIKQKLDILKELLPQNNNRFNYNYNQIAKSGIFSHNPDALLNKNQLNKLSTMKEVIAKTPSAIKHADPRFLKFEVNGEAMASKLQEHFKEKFDGKIKYRKELLDDPNKQPLGNAPRKSDDEYQNEIGKLTRERDMYVGLVDKMKNAKDKEEAKELATNTIYQFYKVEREGNLVGVEHKAEENQEVVEEKQEKVVEKEVVEPEIVEEVQKPKKKGRTK